DFSIKSFSNYQKLILIKHIVGEGNIPWRKHRYESLKTFFQKPQTGSLLRINKNWSLLRDRHSWVICKPFNEEVLERLNGEGNYGFKEFNLSLRKIKYLNNRSNNQTEVIDFETIKNKSLLVRSWKKGDRFSPLGMKGSKKLSDYFIDKKLNNYEKKRQLVLTADDEIIWLCGDRISDKVKITNKTSEMLELSYHR
ncbi:MAG: tRNA lysidine(34) synthetase TilS, partial [Candidatus Neomarinimicrobiota bacterium]|nr:tRNA lysidine(34) synthetase TilS [Candidatus Neomarinimicrobiota bacterium]